MSGGKRSAQYDDLSRRSRKPAGKDQFRSEESRSESLIWAAVEKVAASQQKWHSNVQNQQQNLWLSTVIPDDLKAILAVLPDNQDPVKRPHQIKCRLSEEELDQFNVRIISSSLSQTDYIRDIVLN